MSSTEPTSSKPILNDEQIAFYRDEGYLCLPSLIDAQWIIKLISQFGGAGRAVPTHERI